MSQNPHLDQSLIEGMFKDVSKSRVSIDAASLTLSEQSKLEPTRLNTNNKSSILQLAQNQLLKFNDSITGLSHRSESLASCLNRMETLKDQSKNTQAMRKRAYNDIDVLKQEVILSRTSNAFKLSKQIETLKLQCEKKQTQLKQLDTAMKNLFLQSQNMSQTYKFREEEFQKQIREISAHNCKLEAELVMQGMIADIQKSSEMQLVMTHNKALSQQISCLTSQVSRSREQQGSLLDRTRNLEQKLRISQTANLKSRSGSIGHNTFDSGFMLVGPTEVQIEDLLSNFAFYLESSLTKVSNWKQDFKENTQRQPQREDYVNSSKLYLYNNVKTFRDLMVMLRRVEYSDSVGNARVDIANLSMSHMRLYNLEKKYRILDNEHRNLLQVNKVLKQCILNRPEQPPVVKEVAKVAVEGKEAVDLKKYQQTRQMFKKAKLAYQQTQSQLNESQIREKKLEYELNKERSERRRLHNQVEDLKGNIRVYCRIRPLLPGQQKVNLHVTSDTLCLQSKKRAHKEYKYDAIFGENSSQEEVFEDTRKLVKSALDGFNVCIFTYGQTGSGKTYTLQGNESKAGIIKRSVEELFSLIQPINKYTRVQINVSMLEVYMDDILDLFDNGAVKNDIYQNKAGICYVPKSKRVKVTSVKETLEYYQEGIKTRQVSSTLMNATSSRSHLLFVIYIQTDNQLSNEKRLSKFTLVDLAGSESLGKSKLKTSQVEECKAINYSLSALRSVITGLNNKDSHIKYRDSRLTHLLKDSIGGNSKTLMFVNVSPSESSETETISSLEFANGVKRVQKGVPGLHHGEMALEEPRRSIGKLLQP